MSGRASYLSHIVCLWGLKGQCHLIMQKTQVAMLLISHCCSKVQVQNLDTWGKRFDCEPLWQCFSTLSAQAAENNQTLLQVPLCELGTAKHTPIKGKSSKWVYKSYTLCLQSMGSGRSSRCLQGILSVVLIQSSWLLLGSPGFLRNHVFISLWCWLFWRRCTFLKSFLFGIFSQFSL